MNCNKIVRFSDGTVITDFTEVDEYSIILDKNDCRLFLSPVSRGICLKKAHVARLESVAPLIYKLDIPVDINVPDNTPDLHSFALSVFSAFSPEFDVFVLDEYYKSKSDASDLFMALIEVFETCLLPTTGKVSWRVFGFFCHNRLLDEITGVNNLVYYNVSKRLDAIGYQRQ
jgi:hypothetical protein